MTPIFIDVNDIDPYDDMSRYELDYDPATLRFRWKLKGESAAPKWPSCECGSVAVKATRHSHWCPMYAKS